MKMDPQQFKENLLLYGCDLTRWPEKIKPAGIESLRNSPELQALLAEEEKFERVLKSRKYEEPSDPWVRRIVALSSRQGKISPGGLRLLLSRLLGDEFDLPQPTLIMGSTLMIAALLLGFVIGFSNPAGSISTDPTQAGFQDFLHYKGDALWAKQ
jgi:hypothetical protein